MVAVVVVVVVAAVQPLVPAPKPRTPRNCSTVLPDVSAGNQNKATIVFCVSACGTRSRCSLPRFAYNLPEQSVEAILFILFAELANTSKQATTYPHTQTDTQTHTHTQTETQSCREKLHLLGFSRPVLAQKQRCQRALGSSADSDYSDSDVLLSHLFCLWAVSEGRLIRDVQMHPRCRQGSERIAWEMVSDDEHVHSVRACNTKKATQAYHGQGSNDQCDVADPFSLNFSMVLVTIAN